MRALSEDRRRLWTATWKPKASHVWTNSAVFTDFTVFPPKYQEDSQLKTGWRQELGEMRAMNSRGPLLTFITSCGKTAEALGDAFHLLNKGFCPVRFHIHPLQFFFFFLLWFRYHGYQEAQFFQGSCFIQMFNAFWIYNLERLYCTAQRHSWFASQDSILPGCGKGIEIKVTY